MTKDQKLAWGGVSLSMAGAIASVSAAGVLMGFSPGPAWASPTLTREQPIGVEEIRQAARERGNGVLRGRVLDGLAKLSPTGRRALLEKARPGVPTGQRYALDCFAGIAGKDFDLGFRGVNAGARAAADQKRTVDEDVVKMTATLAGLSRQPRFVRLLFSLVADGYAGEVLLGEQMTLLAGSPALVLETLAKEKTLSKMAAEALAFEAPSAGDGPLTEARFQQIARVAAFRRAARSAGKEKEADQLVKQAFQIASRSARR